MSTRKTPRTPQPHSKNPSSVFKYPKLPSNQDYLTSATESDDNSISSDDCASVGSSGDQGLSITAEFDELIRLERKQRIAEVEDSYLEFAINTSDVVQAMLSAQKECRRLQELLDKRMVECSDLENKLTLARRLLDKEKMQSRRFAEERDNLEIQLTHVKNVILKDSKSKLAEETKEKLAFLNTSSCEEENGNFVNGLSCIKEVNTTGSLLSDMSVSKSEDDLDVSYFQKNNVWRKHRPSTDKLPEPPNKKRRSAENKIVEINQADTVRATTTLTVTKDGPIKATSVIEAVPSEHKTSRPKTPVAQVSADKLKPSAPPAETIYNLWQATPTSERQQSKLRQHTFQSKPLFNKGPCSFCEKRLYFGNAVAKCSVCGAVCHVFCKDKLPLPCIPKVSTPVFKNGSAGKIGDYTSSIPPMVPALIVHCVNEIELRGLCEVGLYRVPGGEKDVKNLKEKFLKRRGVPCLSQVEVPVLCSVVKDFLKSLQEPLVTKKLWHDFASAAEAKDRQDVIPTLCQLVTELPQPNRDTLAYMILHLQKVAEANDCKMPVDNLAKVFGPTIVGYSSDDLNRQKIFDETIQQAKVMECLLRIPQHFWESFVNVSQQKVPNKLLQTPSTDSLLRTTPARRYFPNPEFK